MRTVRARVDGIGRPVICRVVGGGVNEQVGEWVVELETPFEKTGYGQGLLRPRSSTKIVAGPILTCTVEGDDYHLGAGDVVIVDPSGRVTVLYEAASESNTFLLTGSCDNRCIMCSQPPVNGSQGYAAEARAVLEMIDLPPQVLGITGGEPTLLWDELIGLIRRCRERFPDTVLQLLTNGRRFREDGLAKELAEAGEGHILACVPLYADTDDVHNRIVGAPGAFWDTLQGLYNLERNGIGVELRMVVLRQNFQRLRSWSEFVYRSLPFVEHVALMGLEPSGLARANIERVWIDPADYTGDLTAAVRHFHRCGMRVSVFNHQLCTLPKGLWRFARKSISEWKRIYLEECRDCGVSADCGGFFASGRDFHSRMILPVNIHGPA